MTVAQIAGLGRALAERVRCRNIICSVAAEGKPRLARKLAFETDVSADEALAMLASAGGDDPAAAATWRSDRASPNESAPSTVPPPAVPARGESDAEAAALAKQVVALSNAVRGLPA